MPVADEVRSLSGSRAGTVAPTTPGRAPTDRRDDLTLAIAPGRVAAVFAAIVTVLLGAHFTLAYLRYVRGHDWVFGLVGRFDVLREANVPTWYSSSALLACAVLLALVGGAAVRRGERFRWHWIALGLVFAYLSMDEGAMIHETVQANLRIGVDRSDPFYGQAAMIYPALLATTVFVLYLPFMAALPRRTLVLFLAAGALLVGGGVVVDHFGDVYAIAHGADNLTYALYSGVEEGMEMFGVVVFIYALLSHAERHVGALRLVFGADGVRR